MSLKDRFDEMPEDIESDDVKELRSAMLRLQKQLKQSKERNEDLVFATKQAAYDAMLTFGKIVPVPEVKIDNNILRFFELSAHDGCIAILKYYHFTHLFAHNC